MNPVPVLVFIAAALLCLLAIAGQIAQTRRVGRRLRNLRQGQDTSGMEMGTPWQHILSGLTSTFLRTKARTELSEKLGQAGFYLPWHVDVFILVRFFLVLAALFFGYLLFDVNFATMFQNPLPALQLLLFVFLAGRLPNLWLWVRTRIHNDKILASVPQALDFMTICVETGMSIEDSFDRVAEELRYTVPELAAELRQTRSEMLMLDLMRALKRMKKRTKVREIEILADALMQSLRYGTPLVATMQTLATESRKRQLDMLEERAGSISARVGLPLVLLVLFPLVVLLAAPPVVSFFRTL